MWIEDELQKDIGRIQQTIERLTREYKAQLPEGIRTNLRENREKTTAFLTQFYNKLRNAEFDVYRDIISAKRTVDRDHDHDDYASLPFNICEIKNSAHDLPHPRILSELQRVYDSRRHGHGHGHGDSAVDGKYIPYMIYAYIREKSEYYIQFKARIHGREITLYFITFPESHITVCNKKIPGEHKECAFEIATYQIYAYKVFVWLYLVTAMADKECSEKSLQIYFYMTPFKKQRPSSATTDKSSVLSAIHVNTGLTRNCETRGEIVVYRAEEWFKVFIHESMHNFNMDFIELDLREANDQLRRVLCIPHNDILLFESYTEAWARIIYTMFHIYFGMAHASSTQFIRSVREKLSSNSLFYANQAVKVLHTMNLNYANISIQTADNIDTCHDRYAEDTNVYAYYILGGLLSIYALPFLSWCCENNRGSVIRFSRHSGNLPKFVEFISNAVRDPVMVSMVSFIEKAGATGATLRMTMD